MFSNDSFDVSDKVNVSPRVSRGRAIDDASAPIA
jgi:hypothetical protein